jgi:hypothetical protein
VNLSIVVISPLFECDIPTDVFSIVLGCPLIDVDVFEFFCVGKCGGKLRFCNFFVVLEETPRVQFPSGPNCVSAVRGEDGSSAGAVGDKRMLEKDRNIGVFLCGGSELSWVRFNALFPIAHTMDVV